MGDRGRLQTSQLQRMAPNHGDVRFTIETIPNLVRLDKAFTIGARIINNWCVDLEHSIYLLIYSETCNVIERQAKIYISSTISWYLLKFPKLYKSVTWAGSRN